MPDSTSWILRLLPLASDRRLNPGQSESPGPTMRLRLRHRTAIAVMLSVALSMLGTTHVSCDAMPPASGAAEHAHAGAMPGGDRSESSGDGHCELADLAPADREQGSDACGLVAHCAAAMLGIERVANDPLRLLSSSRIAADDSPPRELASAPDAPPPRA